MDLYSAENKYVAIKCTDGEIISGYAYDYTPADENDPPITSITIDHIEIFENEIESIKPL